MSLQMSVVLCQGSGLLDAAALARALARRFPELPALSEVSVKDGIISASWDEGINIAVSSTAAPWPWSDLEGPCASGALWPPEEAEGALRAHSSHLIVTVFGELEPLALCSLLTQLTTAVLDEADGALGVFWANAALVAPKPLFIEFATEMMPEDLPLPIWVDFRVGWSGERISAGFTCGLAKLGHREFEAQEVPEKPSELRERLYDLAAYVLKQGPVLKDGDTLGRDEEERIRVAYTPSAFGLEGEVITLQYEQPSSKKPWWKLWQ
ncbi:protein of unknown function [Andreprevotia lacus DSM 23236]|jgi:hypothetical protein|uniref:DUF4261 domain-containing protein n=1 Tax=Andreprevotia lacus DSM 23236 TaxID=1121001 RepID=A0A1W1XYY2_9NEIS|nr:DUF4261 domain-containing protein [Andreprevotia lacus]SMC29126.1 protein of unknown function [Andreprevotia lacus DSM 23236]